MKQYVVDQIRPEDFERIKQAVDDRFGPPKLDTVYRVVLPPDQLAAPQQGHPDCGPFYLALELLPDRLCCELLVRASRIIRCDCIGYATVDQRNWLIAEIDALLQELEISL
jgi:hypothetical protein